MSHDDTKQKMAARANKKKIRASEAKNETGKSSLLQRYATHIRLNTMAPLMPSGTDDLSQQKTSVHASKQENLQLHRREYSNIDHE